MTPPLPYRSGLAALAAATVLLAPRPSAPVADAQPAPDLDAQFRDTVRPFLDANCGSCHGAERPKADLNLRRFTTPASVAADFAQWEEVLTQLKSGEMPPRTAKTQPTAAQRQAVVAWIEAFRTREAERNAGDPGVVLPRRLSNAEYDATVRDLTGVDIRPARDFPVDPANAAGFDNTGESLAVSPALVAKYLQAAKFVADHVLFMPDGLAFAPFPVVTDTDKDKHGVRRIVDFYQRQPTDLARYFEIAWAHQKRPAASLADSARLAGVSAKYLETVYPLLTGPAGERGPVAAVQALWKALPDDPAGARRGCEQMRDVVLKVRGRTQVKVRNLNVPGMNAGAQALVLWKDREMATNRRTYGGGALTLKTDDLPPAAKAALTPPDDDAGKERYEAEFKRFCDVFPDAFYVKERARVFLGANGETGNAGRLLSAGFHNQMGYFRDDQALCELILDEKGKGELDRLWHEFDVVSDVPARMHSGFIWFERAESGYIAGKEFDPFRAEDKDAVSPAKFAGLADVYVKRTLRQSKDATAIQAVKDHFRISEANIRRVEAARAAAEPKHVAALTAFAEKAYRRRLTADEAAKVAGFYAALRKEEATHEDAVRDTVVRVLMSPHFCFRVDLPAQGAAGRTAPLADAALASRLSYFLWSSMPDRALLDLAEKGRLRDPAVLTAQVRRMLADDKARALATQFGGSWLDFRRFEEHNAVDRGRFPQFDNDLRAAMAEEPVRFLLDVMQTDRPVTDVLGGRHTFVNAALAKHYGMPAPKEGWARVDDADKYGRGGVLPMGAFLTKNAPGLRTSPVKRGYWVVTRLLGERIPPPPPDVPELPADEGKLGTLTLREALAKHREHPSCAGCHARFDSFGLAFEGFGPVGEKRTKDLAGNAVDTRVSFPGNADGDGVAGLRDYLTARRTDAFVDTLCRKLLAYGLGRTLLLSDEPLVAAMKARLARDGHRFAGLVETIVTSPQFLNRRAAGG
ncbi:DUF1592 domain-containing protein [bacterium]|nr:DUF1592 domain-containing protein [bacterium]